MGDQEKKGVLRRLWDWAVVEPVKTIWHAVTSPSPRKGCLCRLFGFYDEIASSLLRLMADLWILLFILWLIFTGIAAAFASSGAGAVPAGITWVAGTIEAIIFTWIYLYVFLGVAILWGIAAAWLALFC